MERLENMKKLLTILTILLTLPIPTLALSADCDVTAGDTATCDMQDINEGASTVLGALTCHIQDIYRRWIDLLGSHVWFYEEIDEIEPFDLYALPDLQSQPNNWATDLTDEGIQYTSEPTDLNGCVGCTWNTNQFSYQIDSPVAYQTYGEGVGGDYSAGPEATCVNAQTSGLLRLGASWTATNYVWGWLENNTNELICLFDDGVDWYIAGDWNKDAVISGTELEVIDVNEAVTTATYGDIEFTAISHNAVKDDYQTVPTTYYAQGTGSQFGESLMILDVGAWDLYSIY